MELEPTEELAIAMHTTPGAYALLVGSGVSSAAGVPTGWQITLDLVRRVARSRGEECEDAEKWYLEKFGKEPNYSEVLDAVGGTQAERNRLLRGYFEPSQEDRDQGRKVPGAGHREIAWLVSEGYVKMIITTNFDRLLELALEDAGVPPQVIRSDDDLDGVMPYVHSRCTVVKLHGDYMDIRIKNMPAELAEYSDEMNAHLDRVLDDFGLIVCGWSAVWDTALRKAIYRCPRRRFTTYWTDRDGLDEKAKGLVSHRGARVIPIESADRFFSDVTSRVKSLRKPAERHPVSVQHAVGSLKQYLSEPRYRIDLEDMIRGEVQRVHERVPQQNLPGHVTGEALIEHLRGRVRQYEDITSSLLAMQAALAHYDAAEQHARAVTQAVEMLAKQRVHSGTFPRFALHRYPALLLLYGVGMASIISEHYGYFAAVLLKPEWREETERGTEKAVRVINVWSVLGDGKWLARPNPNEYTPGSNHLHELMRDYFRPYIIDDDDYNVTFDILEYVVALAFADWWQKETAGEFRGPVGRFGWRYPGLMIDRRPTPVDEFFERGLAAGDDWGLLRAGFFGGSAQRLVEVRAGYQKEVLDHLHWY